jgi:hypothetical protein
MFGIAPGMPGGPTGGYAPGMPTNSSTPSTPQINAPDLSSLLAIAAGTNSSDSNSNPLLDVLTQRLQSQASGMSSSSTSNLASTIDSVINDTQASGDALSKSLQIERTQALQYARGQATDTYNAALDARTGYGTPVVALRALTDTTEKAVADLDKQYQSAILQNDSKTAGEIATLKMQKLQFLNTQEQNLFSNLISVSGLQQKQQAQEQQNQQFYAGLNLNQAQFEQTMNNDNYNKMVTLATQYGIPVSATDTMETIASKVAPVASKQVKLQMDNLVSQTKSNNAQAAKYISDSVNSGSTLDAATVATLGNTIFNNPASAAGVYSFVKTPGQLAQLQDYVQTLQKAQDDQVASMAKDSTSLSDFQTKVANAGIALSDTQLTTYQNTYAPVWRSNSQVTNSGSSGTSNSSPLYRLNVPQSKAANSLTDTSGLPFFGI